MKAKAKNKKRLLKGFTLIELLGVIIVLSILLVLVLPKLTSSVKSKKEELAMLNDDIVYTAAKLYVSEHKNEFEEEDDFVGCIEISTLDNLGYLSEEVTKYDLSNYNYNYVEVRYNNGYNYSLTNTCSPFTHNKTLCTGNNCKACYISKTYNNGVYQYEGKILESSDPSKPLDGLGEMVGYTSDYGCKKEAVIMAAEDYLDKNRTTYPIDDGNTYCIGLNSPLYSEGYITNPIYNTSGTNIVDTYKAKVTYDNGNQSIDIVASGECVPRTWSDPVLYSGFVPIKYVKKPTNSPIYDNYTIYSSSYTKRGNCSTKTDYSYGYWVVADPSEKWYDYNQYWWPNAALLKPGVSKTAGQSLNLNNDVIGMFVWIPRFEYKLGSSYDDLISVNLILSKNYTTTSGYKIPPAFNFGGVQIPGFWIGKFSTTNNNVLISPSVYAVRSLPNLSNLGSASWDIPPSYLVERAIQFSEKHGLNRKYLDSHNIKIGEYAATLYLSQSKYGKLGNYKTNGNSKSGHIYTNGYDYTGNSNGGYVGVDLDAKKDEGILYNDDHTELVSCSQTSPTSRSTTQSGSWTKSGSSYSYTISTTTAEKSSKTTLSFTVSDVSTISYTYSAEKGALFASSSNITMSANLKDSSGTPLKSGSVNAGSSKSVSTVLGAGTYTIELKLTKKSTTVSTSATGKITNITIKDGGWNDSVSTNYANGIGASSTGNVYGVYDLGRPTFTTVIFYNTDYYPYSEGMSDLGLSGYSTKYYDVFQYISDKSIKCNGSTNCDGYGLFPEVPATYYDACGGASSSYKEKQYLKLNYQFHGGLKTYGDDKAKSPYCYYPMISAEQFGRLVLSSN